MSSTDPQMTDGLSAILDPLVQCLNLVGSGTTYQRYQYLSDSIDINAIEKDHSNADGSPLGGFTQEGHEKGSISVQKTPASAKWPRPGHVLQLDLGEPAGIYASTSRFYRVGKPGNARTLNDVSKASFAVSRLYGLVITNFLTEEFGQRKFTTQAAGAWSGVVANLTTTTLNTRTGGVIVYSLAPMPGFTVPAWLTIAPSTGVLSGTSTTGNWEVQVIATETLAGQETRTGFGILNLTIT